MKINERCGGLIVCALISGWTGSGFSPGQAHCVVFLGKTLYSHSASLHPGVASHPGGSRNIPSGFMLQKLE